MSHFFVVAILPKDTALDAIDSTINGLMAQYAGHMAVGLDAHI